MTQSGDAASVALALVGGSCVVGSTALLWGLERDQVTAEKVLDRNISRTTVVPSDKVLDSNNDAIVFVVGELSAETPVVDDQFPAVNPSIASAGAVRVRRTVECLQWVQYDATSKHAGAGRKSVDVKDVVYEKEWRRHNVDSKPFVDAAKDNPVLLVENKTFDPEQFRLGAFTLDGDVLEDVLDEPFTPLSVDAEVIKGRGMEFFKGSDGWFYTGKPSFVEKASGREVPTIKVAAARRLFDSCERELVSVNDAVMIAKGVLDGAADKVVASLKDGSIVSTNADGFSFLDICRTLGWQRTAALEHKVGDHRVRFEYLPGVTYSAWGQQRRGGVLTHYLHGQSVTASNLDLIGARHHVVEKGKHTLHEVLSDRRQENAFYNVLFSSGLVCMNAAGFYLLTSRAGALGVSLPPEVGGVVLAPITSGVAAGGAWAARSPRKAALLVCSGAVVGAALSYAFNK